MRYLTLGEIVELHRMITETSGGATGIRDLGALESAVAQPKATFDQVDLYPSLVDKAAVLCISIVQNHPFVDGIEVEAAIDEQEQLMLDLAAGRIRRDQLTAWLSEHIKGTDNSSAV